LEDRVAGTELAAGTEIGVSALAPLSETEEFGGTYKYTLYILIRIRRRRRR
jgi:hypothetical protein